MSIKDILFNILKTNQNNDIEDLINIKTPVNVPMMAMKTNQEEYHIYQTKDDTYFDIIQLKTDDLDHLSKPEKARIVANWNLYYRQHNEDIKIISMNFPVDLDTNLNYLYHKLEISKNPQAIKALMDEIKQCEYLNKNLQEQEFYIFLFAENENDYQNKMRSYESSLFDDGLAFTITNDKKERLLFKLFNLNSIKN